MLRLHGLIPAVAAAASILLAIVVYASAPDRRLGRVFAFLALALASWNLIFFALYAFDNYQQALDYSRIFRTGGLFLLPAILHLALVLPGRGISTSWRAVLLLDYGVTAAMAFLNALGVLVTHLSTFYWGYYSVGGPGYLVFSLSVVFNFATSIVLLVREYYVTREPRMRLQLKFWLFGMGVAIPLGLTNLLPAYGIRLYPLGNVASVLWAGIVGYAIVRHRLMDIDVVVAKGLAYISVSVIVIGPISCIFLIIQDWAFGEIHYDFSATVVILFLAVGILFPYVRAATERRLGRSLFRTKFAARAALDALASQVIRILDRQRLLELLCAEMAEAFSIDHVAIYLSEGAGPFAFKHCCGPIPTAQAIDRDDRFIRLLSQSSDGVLREEVEGVGTGSDLRTGVMTENGWAVAVPFRSGREIIGILCLGPRRGLEAFTTGDLSILARVTAEAAIALQNARLFEEVRQSRAIISRAGRLSAIGTLAAGIAHEIRNPLVSIQTFFQLAPERLNDDEFMTSFLKLAEAEVQRISNLISELLTFAKSPTPTLRLIDVSEIVERASILLEPQARAQGVRLSHSIEGDLPRVLVDADQIMQVVLNIGLNGIQATPRGGAVTLTCREVSTDGVHCCQIEIVDTGRGIPSAVREAIFDPFFTTKEKGTGLGLAIAQQIVSESGGFIGVSSADGEGSRFVISLPVESRGSLNPRAALQGVCER
ncbi:GAF domain-containing protein [bacterium]|nr:GAF domain-containing protein [bacterium]